MKKPTAVVKTQTIRKLHCHTLDVVSIQPQLIQVRQVAKRRRYGTTKLIVSQAVSNKDIPCLIRGGRRFHVIKKCKGAPKKPLWKQDNMHLKIILFTTINHIYINKHWRYILNEFVGSMNIYRIKTEKHLPNPSNPNGKKH